MLIIEKSHVHMMLKTLGNEMKIVLTRATYIDHFDNVNLKPTNQ
jgi:hypothetical protein